jgi:hypothetical protein
MHAHLRSLLAWITIKEKVAWQVEKMGHEKKASGDCHKKIECVAIK